MTPLAFASFYVQEMGWYLFPIKPMQKAPGLVRWSIEASNDIKQIKEWWTRWPRANIGLDCGRSNIFVLDVDQHSVHADGAASLALLEMLYLPLPSTLRSQTPSNGVHHFFTGRGRNSVGELGPGLDTRGPGGMVLLPPSRTKAGIYKWLPPPSNRTAHPAFQDTGAL